MQFSEFSPSGPPVLRRGHDHVSRDRADLGQGSEHVAVEVLVAREIPHLDAQDILDRAGHVVAFAHRRRLGDGVFERALFGERVA